MKIEIGDAPGFTDATLALEGPVAVLTLNRPAKLNALTLAMHRALLRAIRSVREDDRLANLVVAEPSGATGHVLVLGDCERAAAFRRRCGVSNT